MDAQQSRLAVSLPSMLMTYLTGAGAGTTDTTTTITTTITTTDTDNTQTDSLHAVDQLPDVPEPSKLSTPSSNNRKKPSLLHTPRSGYSSRAPSPTKSFPSLMYAEAEDMSYASGDLSREGSLMSNNGRSRRRSFKPKTSYTICQPPPKRASRQKIHVRARPLLQLHRLVAAARPIPAFELLPSAIFSPALSRAISKVLPSKHSLCPGDLAIVKADKYHQHEESDVDEDESRDVLALICKGRKGDHLAPGTAKIYLDDGTEWEAYSMPSGGYEFVTTDIHGLSTTVRWVSKRPRARRSQSASELDFPRDGPSKKFNFSTISPNSRRHPVIANLTSTTLDINDSYNIPSPTVNTFSSDDASPESPDLLAAEPVDTTDSLRILITATAVWVALREGWCPGYKSDDTVTRSPSSMLVGSPLKAVPDHADFKDGVRRSGSLARILRSASTVKRRSTASAPGGDGFLEEPAMSRKSSAQSIKRRPRAESTSTVIHRTTWPRPDMRTMRKYTGGSVSSRGFGDTGEELTEEEEGEAESQEEMQTPPPKRMSAPSPLHSATGFSKTLVLESPARRSPAGEASTRTKVATPPMALEIPAEEKKRESSGTDMTIEGKEKDLEVSAQSRRKRSRIVRVLLCGMA